MIKVLFKRLSEHAKLPCTAYIGDAGFDIAASETVGIPPGTFVDVPCGFAIDIPPNYWVRITGRSSTLRRRGLFVSEGIIDNEYTGPIFTGVFNLTDKPVVVERGERLGQIIFHKLEKRFAFIEVEELNASVRGDKGFGSSGR